MRTGRETLDRAVQRILTKLEENGSKRAILARKGLLAANKKELAAREVRDAKCGLVETQLDIQRASIAALKREAIKAVRKFCSVDLPPDASIDDIKRAVRAAPEYPEVPAMFGEALAALERAESVLSSLLAELDHGDEWGQSVRDRTAAAEHGAEVLGLDFAEVLAEAAAEGSA